LDNGIDTSGGTLNQCSYIGMRAFGHRADTKQNKTDKRQRRKNV